MVGCRCSYELSSLCAASTSPLFCYLSSESNRGCSPRFSGNLDSWLCKVLTLETDIEAAQIKIQSALFVGWFPRNQPKQVQVSLQHAPWKATCIRDRGSREMGSYATVGCPRPRTAAAVHVLPPETKQWPSIYATVTEALTRSWHANRE